MKLKYLLALVASATLAIGCGSNSSNDNAKKQVTPQEESTNESGALSPSGDTVSDSKMSGEAVVTFIEKGDMTEEQVLAAYPDLSRNIDLLKSVTRLVGTSNNTLDIYAGDRLLMILELSADKYIVREAVDGFSAT